MNVDAAAWTSTLITSYLLLGALFAWIVMRCLDRIGENSSVPDIRRKGAVVLAFLWLPILLVVATRWAAHLFFHRGVDVASLEGDGGPGPRKPLERGPGKDEASADLEELRRKIREAERNCRWATPKEQRANQRKPV